MIDITPGMTFDDLRPGEDVGVIQSNRPNTALNIWRAGQLRSSCAGTRSQYSSVARDYDGTYSAQRQELVEGWEGFAVLQDEFVANWSRPVFRDWLLAETLRSKDPLKDVKTITVPPPQMVANMRVGNMDGFCVGEPWNNRAIMDNIGFTATTTQDIWTDHPEKVLGTTAEWVQKHPNTARAVVAAILDAGKWIDASLANKQKTAETIANKAYVNTDTEVIVARMLGRYQNGLGKSWDDKNHMKFFNDGAVNYPYLSDAMWFLTQHKRWGLLKSHPDYLAVAKQVNRIDIYKQGAAAAGVALPKSDMRSSKLIDGVVWDGKEPAKYADGFKVKA